MLTIIRALWETLFAPRVHLATLYRRDSPGGLHYIRLFHNGRLSGGAVVDLGPTRATRHWLDAELRDGRAWVPA